MEAGVYEPSQFLHWPLDLQFRAGLFFLNKVKFGVKSGLRERVSKAQTKHARSPHVASH